MGLAETQALNARNEQSMKEYLQREREAAEDNRRFRDKEALARTARPTAQEYHDEFVRQHGGNPIEIEVGEWLLPDGARFAQRGQPVYIAPPEHPYDSWRLRHKYLTLRIEPFKVAIRALAAIAETEACVAAGANVIETHTFRWNPALLGPPPESKATKVGLLMLRNRLGKLQRQLAALLAEPAAEVILPLIHQAASWRSAGWDFR
jgi:hypothetical protein